ncbi:hypothetical protein JZO77_24130 [Enterococcus hulanensis]|uniref:P27 family phage terminase small subunit n=1 Tax=Enterococcus hulanensis TaxID=2559929 RepID=UPI001A8F93C8|nr:P27 family phage terminase small subunit [Enterococcus hulanensis]MBO0459821.1 hypothetical protein [Enterococcus hulanensis]
MARQKRKDVYDSLYLALKVKGLTAAYFIDLLDQYMILWDIQRKLTTDIKKRGPIVEWQNGANQKGLRKNDSIVELPKISKRMTDILRQLELDCFIEVNPQEGADNDDEDIGL